ncbi:venom carboxylesterase-6-like [Planococcus citri]|uniref:venom carboxylesterase-6-like n=1 Tax=Planococcus citri TaxID=170843 RepID=UPI0031F967F2
MNYRLGELGFFSANHSSAPGNNGLKDQAEALRWVHRNIHHFGGNPAKVTIYGCSAGGASVHYQMISPTTNGLFQSAISSSGAVPLPWSLQTHDVLHMSRELASSLNCVYEEVNTMMACLRNKSVNEIMDQVNVKLTKGGYPTNFPISAVIEVPHRGAFLSEHPLTLMRKGRIKHIPWLITMAESEGATFDITDMFFNKTKLNEVNSYWNEIMPVIFKYKNIKSEYQKDYISAAIRKYYLKNELLSNQTARRFFQALGDRIFYNGIIETTKLYSAASLGDTYCYKLYYRETPSHPESNRKNYGCLHCDDESYIIKYDTEKFEWKIKKDPDMRRLLTSSIVAFMKNGNPNNPEVELKWEPISKNGVMSCLGIYSYTVQRMEDIENYNTTRFWKSLPLMPIY